MWCAGDCTRTNVTCRFEPVIWLAGPVGFVGSLVSVECGWIESEMKKESPITQREQTRRYQYQCAFSFVK